jgi:hypothetical protein
VRALLTLLIVLSGVETGRDVTPAPHVKRPRGVQVAEAPQQRQAWTFAVLSDLHLPNDHADTVRATVAALVKQKVRFVVITGDHTNGSDLFSSRPRAWKTWWPTIREALQPLRDAQIPVLPIAGNHDTYWPWQRDAYAQAFADLHALAAPLTIEDDTGRSAIARAPFSYAIDVDGVHLAFANIVAQHVHPDVGTWLANDLAAAQGAKRRIVFGHVPVSSIIRAPKPVFAARLGAILEAGRVSHYVAGHEHIVWDENVTLPNGGTLEQISVGCSSGFYQYEPSASSKMLAHCERVRGKHDPMRCTMPDGGGEFVIASGRKHRRVQHFKASYTLFTVDGDDLRVKPMTIVDGEPRPFYLNDR